MSEQQTKFESHNAEMMKKIADNKHKSCITLTNYLKNIPKSDIVVGTKRLENKISPYSLWFFRTHEYDTTCSEFKSFVAEINLSKHATITTNDAKNTVTYLDIIHNNDKIVYNLW